MKLLVLDEPAHGPGVVAAPSDGASIVTADTGGVDHHGADSLEERRGRLDDNGAAAPPRTAR